MSTRRRSSFHTSIDPAFDNSKQLAPEDRARLRSSLKCQSNYDFYGILWQILKEHEEANKKSKIAFGTTLDREIFPLKVPPTRFGNDLNPIKGAPNRGPGCYNHEEVTNMNYLSQNKITSGLGYTLGARTGPRLIKQSTASCAPDPGTYQTKCTDPIKFSESYRPFHSGTDRFPTSKSDLQEVNPGPGTYPHELNRQRKVEWHQAFGKTPINLPTVSQQSTIHRNTDKLLSTKEEKKYHRKLAYLKLYYD